MDEAEGPEKRTRFNIGHGARKISFLPTGGQVLRQPSYPNFLGPMAFRPTITTRGLALSAMLFLAFSNIL